MAQNEIETPKSVMFKESENNTDNEADDEGNLLAAPMLSPRQKKDTITESPVTPLTPLVDDDNTYENELESKMEEPTKVKSKTPQTTTNNNNDSIHKPKVEHFFVLCFVQG